MNRFMFYDLGIYHFLDEYAYQDSDEDDWSMGFYHACLMGKQHLAQLIIDRSKKGLEWQRGFNGACRGGHHHLVHWLCDFWGARRGDYLLYCVNHGLKGACRGGHFELAQLMIVLGAYEWRPGLAQACRGGHRELVQLMIEKGAQNWSVGLYQACRGGHLELVKLMIEKGGPYGPNVWHHGLYRACQGGHPEIVQLMIEKGATNLHQGVLVAGTRKHFDLVRWMIDLEDLRPEVNHVLDNACHSGKLDFVQCVIEKGATNWNKGLSGACRGGHRDLIQLMIKYGATSCDICQKSMDEHIHN